MSDSNAKKNLKELAKGTSKWMDLPEYKKENRKWLRRSLEIALRVHEILEQKGMSQADFAKALGVSRQQISKFLKGQENLTLDTISKFEEVLGVDLIIVPDEEVNALPTPVQVTTMQKLEVLHAVLGEERALTRVSDIKVEYTLDTCLGGSHKGERRSMGSPYEYQG